MILRNCIICQTCEQELIIRVFMGNDSYQQHDFSCKNCEEPIGLGLYIDRKKMTHEFDFYENCELSEKANIHEGIIVNLVPYGLVPQDSKQFEFFAVPPDEFFRIAEYNKKIKPILVERPVNNRFFLGHNHIDIHQTLGGLDNTVDLWKVIQKAWSLTNNKHILVKKILQKYNPDYFNGSFVFNEVLFSMKF